MKKKHLDRFFIGLTIFSASIILKYIVGDNTLTACISLLGILMVCLYGYKLIDVSQKLDQYFKVLFFFLILWEIFVILRGVKFTYESIRLNIFTQYEFWPFIVVFAALFIKNTFFFKRLFDWLYYWSIVFLLFSVVGSYLYIKNVPVAEQSIWSFGTSVGFLLLTWNYNSQRRRFFAMLSLFVALVFSALTARRNILLTLADFAIFSYLMYLFYYTGGNMVKKTTSMILVFVAYIAGITYYQSKHNNDFALLNQRATENTRDYVFVYYFADMQNSYLLGKGLNGEYYCPIFSSDNGDASAETQYRNVIENGYLQIILKGGIINLLLFLLIALPACFKGFFLSKNGLSKACSIIILLWLIDMFPFGLPVFSIRYILFWIAVGVSYSKEIRTITEAEMKFMLKAKN